MFGWKRKLENYEHEVWNSRGKCERKAIKGKNIENKGESQLWEDEQRQKGHTDQKYCQSIKSGAGEVEKRGEILQKSGDYWTREWESHRGRLQRKRKQENMYSLGSLKLVCKLGRLREGDPWSRYMVSQLYSSITSALAQHKKTLISSSSLFKNLLDTMRGNNFSSKAEINTNEESVVRHALKK